MCEQVKAHPMIQVEGISKVYRIGEFAGLRSRTLREEIVGAIRRPLWMKRGGGASSDGVIGYKWALRDISFQVGAGEVLGVIGRNGAGKSTLLKILARITEPTAGRADLFGRVGSLLEVGTGFHPELTGRENVYLSGAILGMRKSEVERHFEAIVDFAGVSEYLNTPVKRYSSGMRVRLGFAVAAHLQPEILLVDEVLSVGDAAFQQKCLDKMGKVSHEGRTILFVSHNMAAISALCDRCLCLEDGAIVQDGAPDEVIREYLSRSSVGQIDGSIRDREDRRGDGTVRITDIRFLDHQTDIETRVVHSGQDVRLVVDYESTGISPDGVLPSFNLGLAFFTSLGQFVMVLNSEMANRRFEEVPANGRVCCVVRRFPLMSGLFRITATLHVQGRLTDQVQEAASVHVEPGDFFGTGIPNAASRQGVYCPQEWLRAEAHEDNS